VFTHGIASFDPAPDRVILWTAVSSPGPVHWELDDLDGRRVDGGTVRAERPGPVWVDVGGLRPGTDYSYRFHAGGLPSPPGRTRTLPGGSPDRWRLGVCCCADRSIHHFTVYQALAAEDVDAVLHLGDYIYETAGKGGRRLEPDGPCVTLDDFRLRYAQVRRDPAVQALHTRHPVIAIWDDHDIADNAWRHGAKGHDPAVHGDWEDRLRAAAVARQEWLPARLADPEDPLRLWRSVRVGDLAELVVSDTRIDGRDQQAGDPGARPLDDPDRSLVGPAQRAWLAERIRDRSATWCLLATQVTMSPMRLPVPVGATLLETAPSGYGVVDGAAVCTDEWDGYPAERRRVAGWLAERGAGAVVLSGDVHSSWVYDGAATPGMPPGAPELVCPAVSSTPLGRQLPRAARRTAARAATGVDGPRWFDLSSWGYLLLEVTASTVTARYRFVDATRPVDAPRAGPTFAVDLDPPGRLRAVGEVPDPVAAEPPAHGLDRLRADLGSLDRLAHRPLLLAALSVAVAATATATGFGVAALAGALRRRRATPGPRRAVDTLLR
jgi:alkaline phosphatase D